MISNNLDEEHLGVSRMYLGREGISYIEIRRLRPRLVNIIHLIVSLRNGQTTLQNIESTNRVLVKNLCLSLIA